MSDPITDYARAVAEAVLMVCEESGLPDMDAEDVRESLSDIIASVPRPTAQHHDAPTCDGWWWARHSFNRRWEAVLYVYDGNQEEPEQYVVLNGQEEGRDVSEFDAWVGPLLPPDTTEPASVLLCEKVPHEQRGGYLHAEDDDTPYYVDGLRYCGRCHHFLDEGESHRAAPAPVATPTPDIDPEEVRRRLDDAFDWRDRPIHAAAREYLRLREQPAPDEELPRRGGGTIGVGTLAYFQANNENQLQQAMLRRVIALEKALGRERARALLCERLGVEAESLGDLLCARSDLDAISDVMLAAGAMFNVGVEVLPDLSQQLPIHGPVRLPSMPIVPQPAPDVQAVKLCNCGKCCPGPLYSQHERDAAVAREREEVQAHAPLYLEWVKEGALSADDALERLVIWLRARSAKGV